MTVPIPRRALGVVALVAALVPAIAGSAHASDDSSRPHGDPAHAIYGDQVIDLARSWGTARACIELDTETRCYRTDAELREAHADLFPTERISARASCSSPVALFDLTGFNPPVAYFTTRGVFHNLSLFGFDQRTSSYQVNACAAAFFDGQGGGGTVYPGSTAAWATASSMLSGWNDRIRSIYIY
ncbi:MAG: hypothetical protein GX610_13115 [Rhodococcus sp.]|nr:hypothetical protein [Rhodococcus sp. (in: high G+C Gram-positive bacteria)]